MGFNSGTDLLKTLPGEGCPAVVMLQKLRALPAVGSGGLYADLIKHAKGIVFLSTWKAGVIYVGGQMGAGFVVAHLSNGEWSAPAFFKWHGVGGGITFGVSKADTVIILNSDRAMAQYQSREMNFKFGAGLSVDYVKPDEAGNVEGGGLAAKINSGESDAFVFNFSKGLLFDLTITGGVTTSDESANARVYANVGATPDQILAGAFPHPHEATNLYQALQT